MRAYRTKVAEPIRIPDREDREEVLAEAGYNLFAVDAEDVYVDLLTDSGTGAMSAEQWAALMGGDEAYAGSRSFHRLREAVEDVLGFPRVVPAHQGRGAENVLYGAVLSEGDVVPNNTHFDTTRAHVANQGAEAVDCPVEGAMDPDGDRDAGGDDAGDGASGGRDTDAAAEDHDGTGSAGGDFLGNLSIARAREAVEAVGADRVPMVMVTVTNNSAAGQPVSVRNLRRAREFADEVDALLVVDACRFAENAYFVQRREPGFGDHSVAEIVREQLSVADAVIVSGKKDGLVNVGGFVALRADHEELFEACKQRAILYEGFPTYGGMAGRDMAAMAQGLREAVEESYLADRVETTRELADGLAEAGMPVYRPVGGHAVYVDAGRLLDVPGDRFPGQALVVELYREGAVRTVELGELAFPGADRPDLVRFALPRRTYGREHLDHVVDTARAVVDRRESVPGYEIVRQPGPPELRHFSAELRPVDADAAGAERPEPAE